MKGQWKVFEWKTCVKATQRGTWKVRIRGWKTKDQQFKTWSRIYPSSSKSKDSFSRLIKIKHKSIRNINQKEFHWSLKGKHVFKDKNLKSWNWSQESYLLLREDSNLIFKRIFFDEWWSSCTWNVEWIWKLQEQDWKHWNHNSKVLTRHEETLMINS